MSSVSTNARSRNQKQNQTSTFQTARERLRYPRQVATAPDLSSAARQVLIVLWDMAFSGGSAWPHQATLAAECGLHLDTVRHALKEAEARGLVRAKRGRRGCRYFLPWANEEAESRPDPQARSRPDPQARSNAPETICSEQTHLNAVVEAPPAAAQTPPPETAPAPLAPTAEETSVRRELQRHSAGPVAYADARRAITAHGVEPVIRWAARRRGDRLHHAGAVLTVLARDSQAEAEALAALAVPPAPQEAAALTPTEHQSEAATAPQALPEGMTRADLWRLERARAERTWHRRRVATHQGGAALERVGNLLSAYSPAGLQQGATAG